MRSSRSGRSRKATVSVYLTAHVSRQAIDLVEPRVVEGEPKTSKLLAMLSGEADFGSTTTSWSMCPDHSCAGVTP